MGFFSALSWPEPVTAINAGMKNAISLTIREINIDGEDSNLHNPHLLVGKGHIRICSNGTDDPPITVKINSFREKKEYGVKTYRWTINNGYSDVAELVFFIENNSVGIWTLRNLNDRLPFMRIVSDKRSF